MSYTQQRDPDSGGVKITDTVKSHLKNRITKYAEKNLAGRYTKLDIRFRDKFCYVDAYTEPEEPRQDWPADFPETREEGRIPIFPVMLLALDCAWLPSVSGNSNAQL